MEIKKLPSATTGRLLYLSSPEQDTAFAALYTQVREQEGRIYPDEVVQRLPEIDRGHPLEEEWKMRRDSARRLCRYLRGRPGPLTILEVGCGNGWLSAQMARIPRTQVVGLDVNPRELEQAARVFAEVSNLCFVYGNLWQDTPPHHPFDVIVLASVVQYFPDLSRLIRRLQEMLKPEGEIHILDSPFYSPETVDSARHRTAAYYRALGVPEMARHYFHHLQEALAPFHPHLAYDPGSFLARIRRRWLRQALSPFPWFVIRKCP